jgi:hypothetical protein
MKLTKTQLRQLIKEEIELVDQFKIMADTLKSLGFKRPAQAGVSDPNADQHGDMWVKDFGNSCIALVYGQREPLSNDTLLWWGSWHIPYKSGVVSKVLSKLSGKRKLKWDDADNLIGKSFGENYLDLGEGFLKLDKAGIEGEIKKRVAQSIQKAKSEGLI